MEMGGQTISYCAFNAIALIISSENALSYHLYVGIVAKEGIQLVHAGLYKSKARRAQISIMQDQDIMLHKMRVTLPRDLDPTRTNMVMAVINGTTTVNLGSSNARICSLEDMTGETLANKGNIGNKGGSDQMVTITLIMDSNTITNNNTTTTDHTIMSMHWNLLSKKIDLFNRRGQLLTVIIIASNHPH